MQQDIINKYGKDVVNNFWIFIGNLNFLAKTQEATTIRASILKKLSPALADKYKEIGDEFAFSLYRQVYYDKKNAYLYASFEAVSKGSDFYDSCWLSPVKIESIVEALDQFNNFSTVLPTEDDYFNIMTPTPQEVWDDYEDYDEQLESVGNKKSKKRKDETKNDD